MKVVPNAVSFTCPGKPLIWRGWSWLECRWTRRGSGNQNRRLRSWCWCWSWCCWSWCWCCWWLALKWYLSNEILKVVTRWILFSNITLSNESKISGIGCQTDMFHSFRSRTCATILIGAYSWYAVTAISHKCTNFPIIQMGCSLPCGDSKEYFLCSRQKMIYFLVLPGN